MLNGNTQCDSFLIPNKTYYITIYNERIILYCIKFKIDEGSFSRQNNIISMYTCFILCK